MAGSAVGLARARDLLLYSFKHYANLWLLLAVQVPFYWYFSSTRLIIVDVPVLRGAAMIASVIALVCLFNWLLARLRSRALRVALNLLFVMFYVLLIAYRWRRGAGLDFAVLASNIGEAMSRSGARAFAEVGGVTVWLGAGALLLALGWLELRYQVLSTFHEFERPWRALLVLLGLTGAAMSPWVVPNEFLLFAKSIQRYWRHPEAEALKHVDDGKPFPLFHAQPPQRPPSFSPEQRPHIFLLLMESFSADFVQKRDELGREYTPFFNSLIPRGAYHKLFYSNSMQSERGQTATLCSMIPSYRRKVMVSYVQDHFLCLPELLKRAGYLPIWTQGGSDPSFDNIGEFMPKAGFEQVVPMNYKLLKPEDYQHIWGWGLQDDLFFTRYLAHLDQVHAEDARPTFTVMATISNHMQFNAMPAEDRKMYADPQTFREAYVNSIHLADDYLRTFFEQLARRDYLKNSLIIMLGDHGYPVGQHGVSSNEVSYYDELFHVPLLVLGPGVQPFVNDRVAYSQLDLEPTLLEWLGISAPSPAVGVAIPFSQADLPATQHDIPLIQPYDGCYLGALRYPFKYVQNLSSDERRLFDLARDPREEHDLLPAWGERAPLPELAQSLATVYLNQRLLEEDRLVPH